MPWPCHCSCIPLHSCDMPRSRQLEEALPHDAISLQHHRPTITLHGNGTSNVNWWVESSHSTYSNLHRHSGFCATLSKGMIVLSSLKQKLNTQSSTKTELITANDSMPILLWMNNFLHAQGFNLDKTILHQDNQSAILLQKNGRLLSSKCTRHLDMCYFFITDCITHGDLTMKYCPTKEIIADFMTKLLQGTAFIKFQQALMNLPTWNTLHIALQECVGGFPTFMFFYHFCFTISHQFIMPLHTCEFQLVEKIHPNVLVKVEKIPVNHCLKISLHMTKQCQFLPNHACVQVTMYLCEGS